METNPDVVFYAYTKQVKLLRAIEKSANFTVIFSQGGIFDSLINKETERHSVVFDSLESLLLAGYTDASTDDSVAFTSQSGKLGLVYHGAKGLKQDKDNFVVKSAA
jgi:hypothetical protein